MPKTFGYCNTCYGKIWTADNKNWFHIHEGIHHPAAYRDPITHCMNRRFGTSWCINNPDGHKRHTDGKYSWGKWW